GLWEVQESGKDRLQTDGPGHRRELLRARGHGLPRNGGGPRRREQGHSVRPGPAEPGAHGEGREHLPDPPRAHDALGHARLLWREAAHGILWPQFSFANGYPEFKLIPLQDVTLSRERSGTPGEPPLSIPVHIRRRAPQADFFETVARSMQNAKKRLIA